MQLEQDTIVAISTPPGRGGIGIVRLSGARALAIALPLVHLRHPPAPAHARFGHLLAADGSIVDEIVLTWFAAPHSYTAEDVVEIATHGAPVVLQHAVRAAVAGGARLAEPGEFTRRAFLNDRLDLTQAEAVHDLIGAHTMRQAQQAAAQLGGALAQAIAPVRQRLLELLAALEAGIDFVEDDLDLLSPAQIDTSLSEIRSPLQQLAATYVAGRVVREGFTLAIAGRPNAGKSSLFNRLLEEERAIVTPEPGTTRDPVTQTFALDGIPVSLTDTAGLREPVGEAEAQGIARSRTSMAQADLVLCVIDATTLAEGLHPEDASTLQQLQGRPHLLALNKCDLLESVPPLPPPLQQTASLMVSAATGQGLCELRQALLQVLRADGPALEGALVTSLRQHAALASALQALNRAAEASGANLPHELLLLDLYAALEALDSFTGHTAPDTVLNLIFSTFCIGK